MNYFTSEGRCGRGVFFATSLFCRFAQKITEFITGVNSDKATTFGICVYFIVAALTLYVFAMVGSKRCHDLGHKGWWLLIPLYYLWLYIAPGQKEDNEYGPYLKEE